VSLANKAFSDSWNNKAVVKAENDLQDIEFLIKWLAERNTKIAFDLHTGGKTVDEMLEWVVPLYRKYQKENDLTSMAALERVVEPAQWQRIVSLPRE
jgi:hypothetical protein